MSSNFKDQFVFVVEEIYLLAAYVIIMMLSNANTTIPKLCQMMQISGRKIKENRQNK